MAVPWPRPRAAPHCRPARPTAAPSRHRTGRRTALRTRPSGRLSSGGRAGPSPRPLPGHCCPLGWHGRRRLGRIRSGARSLGQHRQLRPPRLPPPTTAGPPGGRWCREDRKLDARAAKGQAFYGLLPRPTAGHEVTSADRGRWPPRQVSATPRHTAHRAIADHVEWLARQSLEHRYSAQFEHRPLPVSTPGYLCGMCKRPPATLTPAPPCAHRGPGCPSTATQHMSWPPSSPAPPANPTGHAWLVHPWPGRPATLTQRERLYRPIPSLWRVGRSPGDSSTRRHTEQYAAVP